MEATASTDAADVRIEQSRELRKEAGTMALYVSVCLLAALTAVNEGSEADDVFVIALVWGTTLGLAIAHWFAFRVSAQLVAAGRLGAQDARIAGVQLVAAAAVAVLVTVPVLLLPFSSELDAARLILSGFIASAGYLVASSGGASRLRSVVYAAMTLLVGSTVAVLKNILSGH